MATLPTSTRAMDDYFIRNWYDVKAEATDNILESNVIYALLKEKKRFVQQRGGQFITRTVRYGEDTAENVQKGDTLPQGEPDLKTAAQWTWKYIAGKVQRNIFDDQQNSGPTKIIDYVADRLDAAREAVTKQMNTNMIRAFTETEVERAFQGLNHLVPPYVSRAAGTMGTISRSNTWWQCKYKVFTAPMEVNLVSDMRNAYNTATNHQEPPNVIICSQTLFELYEDFGLEMAQIIKDEASKLVDLGFDVLRFKGKPMVWTSGLEISTKEQMLMLNLDYIDVVYDPSMWFDMTNWKDIALEGTRIAHILSALNMLTVQPRRHIRLYEA